MYVRISQIVFKPDKSLELYQFIHGSKPALVNFLLLLLYLVIKLRQCRLLYLCVEGSQENVSLHHDLVSYLVFYYWEDVLLLFYEICP